MSHSFDITATPTLQAVATPDETALVHDLQKRVEEALAQSGEQSAVVAAADAHRQAEVHLQNLRTAARALNVHARELREQSTAAVAKTLDRLIESASGGEKPEFGQVSALASLDLRERLTSRAIERLVEHQTPLAQIARLRAESHALVTRARAIEHSAQQRAEKVLGQLRDAVSDEVVLPVDMSKGVVGMLLTHATELKRLAVEAAKNADDIERAYMERNRKESL